VAREGIAHFAAKSFNAVAGSSAGNPAESGQDRSAGFRLRNKPFGLRMGLDPAPRGLPERVGRAPSWSITPKSIDDIAGE